MKKAWKALLFLLVLALLPPLGEAAVYADGETAVRWTLSVRDGEQTLSFSDESEVAAALGKGFSLDFGKDSEGRAATVDDLRRSGLTITPPAGYSLSSVQIAAVGTQPEADSRSLLVLGQADTSGSGAVTLPAAIFAADFDASAVGTVFSGSGENGYTVLIALEKNGEGPFELRYSDGTVDLQGPAAFIEGGDSVSISPAEGALFASVRLAAPSEDAAEQALRSFGKRFSGWRLSFPNGSSALLNAGDSLNVLGPVNAEAQWTDTLVFSFPNAEKLYDGTPLSVSYTQSGELKEGDVLDLPDSAVHASRTEAGSSEATLDLSALHIRRGEEDVTGEYSITVLPGTLRVVRRGVTFRVCDVNAPYSASPVYPSEYAIVSGELVEGHRAAPAYSGQQTLPGSSTGSAVFTIYDALDNDVSNNYEISVINGSITVTEPEERRAITVTVQDAEKEYDGTNAVSASYSISSGELLGGDRLVAVSCSGSIVGVGSGHVNGVFAVKNGEADVSANYDITVVPGTLTVRPRAITLTAASAEREFDGNALSADSFSVSAGSLVEGHTVTATVVGSQTKVGSSANRIDPKSVAISDANGQSVLMWYSVKLADGTLEVKAPAAAAALTITMKSAEKTYDGKELTSRDYAISAGALLEGDTLVLGEVSGAQTVVGECELRAAFSVKRGETDVTDSYSITVVPGKLSVKARAIIITAASATKIFDGKPLTRDSFSVSSGELVKGHKLSASVTGSQTAIGSSANSIVKSSIKITDEKGADVTANYAITTAAGTLTVGRDPVTAITLSPGEHTKVYDGLPFRFRGSDLRVTAGSLPAGYTVEASFNPEAPVDVGKYDVTIKGVTIRNASGADVTNQFNITRSKGTLTITPRPLVIETSAANKIYDGSALTERSTPKVTGRVDGQQITLRITGSQTKVGSSENTVSDVKITDKENGADVTRNYDISYQFGLLTVSEASENNENCSWVSGSSGTLFIKLDHAYDGFVGLTVDGREIDRSCYTSASGSTDVWLKADYLNTLPPGNHTLSALYSGGESVKAAFTVSPAQDSRGSSNRSLTLWIVIMILALLAIIGSAGALIFSSKGRKRWPARKK